MDLLHKVNDLYQAGHLTALEWRLLCTLIRKREKCLDPDALEDFEGFGNLFKEEQNEPS